MSKYFKISLIVFVLSLCLINTSLTFAATNITVSGNGSGSQNTVKANNSSFTSVLQSNISHIFNSIFSSANTGDNSSSDNTGGNSSIRTGNSSSSISVVTRGNTNVYNPISVPEFGMIPGVIAAISSGGAFLFLKKRFN